MTSRRCKTRKPRKTTGDDGADATITGASATVDTSTGTPSVAVGTVSTGILTDIANAIRYKAGVATLYKPREMAAAVSVLDGTEAGEYQEQPYMAL